MHSTRACFAFITMGMKELQRKLLKQSLYEKFFWGQAVELALVLVTMTLKVLVTSPTLRPWTAEADMADKWGSVMSAFTTKNHLSLETTEFWVGDRQVFGSRFVLALMGSAGSFLSTRRPMSQHLVATGPAASQSTALRLWPKKGKVQTQKTRKRRSSPWPRRSRGSGSPRCPAGAGGFFNFG